MKKNQDLVKIGLLACFLALALIPGTAAADFYISCSSGGDNCTVITDFFTWVGGLDIAIFW